MKKIFAGLMMVATLALFGCGDITSAVKSAATSSDSNSSDSFTGNGTKFTSEMVAGRTFDITSAEGKMPSARVTFSSDGIATRNNGEPATWIIDAAGKLTVIVTSSGYKYELLISGGALPVISVQILETQSSAGIESLSPGTMTVVDNSGTPVSVTAFTTAMLAGKTVTEKRTNGDTNVFVFAATGNVVSSGTSTETGTFTINSNGTLTVTASSDSRSLTYTIVSGSGSVLTVTRINSATPTVVEEPSTMTIAAGNGTSSTLAFTTAMLAGKKLQQTFNSGPSTTTYNTDGTISFTKGTINGTGTWSIAQNGILTVNFNVTPADGLIFSLVQDNGASLTADYKHIGATVWEARATLTYVP